MTLPLLRLLFDFGLLVLIWLVQLVIYPSFLAISHQKLLEWHRSYTARIALVVIPLMIGEFILHAAVLYQRVEPVNVVMGLIVLLLWAITFGVFVPLHARIDAGKDLDASCLKLVRYNWWRTFLWTLLFGISFGSLI